MNEKYYGEGIAKKLYSAYFTMIYVWVLYFPFLLLRINIEEKELIKKFGIQYIEYKKRVWAFLPIRYYK